MEIERVLILNILFKTKSMDFGHVVENVIAELDAAGVRYALIGGFAMALRGIQRATLDLDFILMLEDLDRTDAIFQKAGYRQAFRSENVSHYTADENPYDRNRQLASGTGGGLDRPESSSRL